MAFISVPAAVPVAAVGLLPPEPLMAIVPLVPGLLMPVLLVEVAPELVPTEPAPLTVEPLVASMPEPVSIVLPEVVALVLAPVLLVLQATPNSRVLATKKCGIAFVVFIQIEWVDKDTFIRPCHENKPIILCIFKRIHSHFTYR